MSGFLDNYGAGEERREKIVRTTLYIVLATAVAAGLLWYFFRNYREEGRVREFLSLLERKDYKAAYPLWGCTEAAPCRDYSYERFLQDWGPGSEASGGIQRSKVKSCDGGIIQVLQIKGQEVNLYVDRATLIIGFSPWPVCNPRIKL